jgi:nitrate reductase gamma subunit
MSWKKKTFIYSIVWIVFTIIVGIIHTEVFLAGKLTQQQDEIISECYGMACAIGVVLLWIIQYLRNKKRK